MLSRCQSVMIGTIVISGWVAWLTTAMAAPLDLSQTPIYLNSSVEPNILFIADDSGSMDWEVLTKDAPNFSIFTGTQPTGTPPASPDTVKHRDHNDDGTPDCNFTDGTKNTGYIYVADFDENNYDNNEDNRRCNTADDESWRMRTHAFNPMYFDSNKTYKPWPGVDKLGNPFVNMPITAAKANPYEPTSETIDLTRHNSGRDSSGNRATSDRNGDGNPDGFRYYTWTDSDSDGLFDNGEEAVHFIKDADAATKQNFANWFSYYRKRDYVAKVALGEVIAKSTNFRMGLVTLNNPNSINIPIRSMNPEPNTGNKKALMDKLYAIDASGSTYLRSTLDESGKYLSCEANALFPAGECPSLNEASGGACQQNFVILMTDGYDNAGDPSVGDTDGDNNTAFDGGAYADSWSNTLADVAMYYYESDLRTGLPNQVPVQSGVDEATHQHMVTHTVAFGVTGTLTSNPPNATDPFSWPDPALSNTEKIDDMRHAAFNGRGQFLSTQSPHELSAALHGAINSVGARLSSAAAMALNGAKLDTDSHVYQSRFTSGFWTGNLLAFALDGDGNVQTTPAWDAQSILDGRDWDTERTILTYNPDTLQGASFRWADLASTQQAQLHTNAQGSPDGQGADRLTYLRGNTEHEGQGHYYRLRQHRLGDLVHAAPYYVGEPPFPDTLGPDYASFRGAYNGRTKMVYAGGNDGMLHGFDATSGIERLAYIPNKLFGHLSKLTDPAYSHRYYVDGSPTVGDAHAEFDACAGTCWRSVLVSGLRGGGQGVFALDVTDPGSFSESSTDAADIVMWEFTDAHDPDLGYTFSQPSIVRMANDRWAAVIGNGYNNTEADGPSTTSTSGHAVLYILFLDGGLDGNNWSGGTDFIKIDTGQGALATPNGLATPAVVDIDGDMKADLIYAGDLEGNLWKFDVRDADPSQWIAKGAQRVFKTDGGKDQPITTRPEVGVQPWSTDALLIYVGTGKYLEPTDHSTSIPTQTFYAIVDTPDNNITVYRSDLLGQSLVSIVSNYRLTTDMAIDWTTHKGWFFDFPTTGERSIARPVLRNDRIIFTTFIPGTQVCGSEGSGWLMELNALTGSRLAFPPFDLNGDHNFDDNDLVSDSGQQIAPSGLPSPVGALSTPAILWTGRDELKYSSGSSSATLMIRENPGSGSRGRQAWRPLP